MKIIFKIIIIIKVIIINNNNKIPLNSRSERYDLQETIQQTKALLVILYGITDIWYNIHYCIIYIMV